MGVAPGAGLQINGVPLYLHGFGKHEDAELRGRGLDLPTLIKDWELLGWVRIIYIYKYMYIYIYICI